MPFYLPIRGSINGHKKMLELTRSLLRKTSTTGIFFCACGVSSDSRALLADVGINLRKYVVLLIAMSIVPTRSEPRGPKILLIVIGTREAKELLSSSDEVDVISSCQLLLLKTSKNRCLVRIVYVEGAYRQRFM